MQRAHIVITGSVQGVSFRAFTFEQAINLKLNGWVKNRKNGEVEIEVEGEQEKIKELIHNLKEGPSISNVENVNVNWKYYKNEFNEFIIEK